MSYATRALGSALGLPPRGQPRPSSRAMIRITNTCALAALVDDGIVKGSAKILALKGVKMSETKGERASRAWEEVPDPTAEKVAEHVGCSLQLSQKMKPAHMKRGAKNTT